jgi:hypothetical protein
MISESKANTQLDQDHKLLFATKPIIPTQFLRHKRISLIKKKNQNLNEISFRVGKWDMHEHKLFLKACLVHGNNWARVIYKPNK